MGDSPESSLRRISGGAPLKIAILGARNFPAEHGGLEVVVENLARSFARRGESTSVYVSAVQGDGEPNLAVVISPTVRKKYLHTALQLISGLRSIIRSEPDVVSIHGVGPAFVLLLAPRFFARRTTVVTCHGLDWERSKWPKIAQVTFKRIAIISLKRATAVTAVSRATADQLERELRRPVAVLSNGFQVVDEAPKESVAFDLPERFSLCISRLTPEKNIETVIRAYTDGAAERLGPLLIIGGGANSYSSGYAGTLYQLDNPHVRFLGHLPHSSAQFVLSRANLFISMSRLEAQPMSVMEAMAAGTPLLMSNIPEHVEMGASQARYVHPDDIEGLTMILERGELPSVADIRTAQQRALTRTWSTVALEYLELFEALRRQAQSSS